MAAKLLLFFVSFVFVFVSFAHANSKIAFEVELSVETQILRAGPAKKGFIVPGDDRFNFVKEKGWLVSMDNAKTKGRVPKGAELDKVKAATGLASVERDAQCDVHKKCAGILELKTAGTVPVSLKSLKEQKDDFRHIRQHVLNACTKNTGVAVYSRTEPTTKQKEYFVNYPRCDPDTPTTTEATVATRVSEVQITINLNLNALLHPKSAMVKKMVQNIKSNAERYSDWLTNAELVKVLAQKPVPCVHTFQAALLLSDYWLTRSHHQKQSINPLPKVGICELWDRVKTVCEWDGLVAGRYLGEVLGLADNGRNLYMKQMLGAPGATRTEACKLQSFNGHAGFFPIGQHNKKDTVALEYRKADDEPIAKFITEWSDAKRPKEAEINKELEDLAHDI